MEEVFLGAKVSIPQEFPWKSFASRNTEKKAHSLYLFRKAIDLRAGIAQISRENFFWGADRVTAFMALSIEKPKKATQNIRRGNLLALSR